MPIEAVRPPRPTAAEELPAEGASAQHWESVARRTRSVAEQWRTLHASEEARADAAQAAAARAVAAMKKSEHDRDTALRKAEEAKASLAASKQERARWKARSDAQTASKTFLELEECREALRQRDAELAATQRANAALHLEFEAFKHKSRLADGERQAAARDRLEGLMAQREEAVESMQEYETQVFKMRREHGDHLAESPPGSHCS